MRTKTILDRGRRVGHIISPRYWRWRRFLSQLRLDPGRLARPLEAPGAGDFIICGCPRTGTSLLSAMLHQPPTCLTVMEPWDGMRLPPAELFASLREEIGQTGRLARGKLDIGAMSADGEVRWRREGAAVEVETRPEGYLLGVKWPAFWRYLDLLPDTRFLVCLRHPAEVISSFKKVGGRLAQGLEYDIAFHHAMNAELRETRDVALRRVQLFEYIHRRILPHLSRENVLAVRYERWFTEPEAVMREIRGFLQTDLIMPNIVIRRPGEPAELNPGEELLISQYCQRTPAIGYST